MYNRNAAYDFRTLERQKRSAQIVELPGRRARRKEKLKAKRTLLTAVFSVFMVSAMVVSGFVMGQVKLTEITDQTEKASRVLDERESSNTQLRMELESKNTAGSFAKDSVHNEVVKISKENLTEVH
ncbi:MAG: hypothetical protein IKE05_01030 [Clostridia bacterium]|nr:hypothetical protein [Clostridia bacterium]